MLFFFSNDIDGVRSQYRTHTTRTLPIDVICPDSPRTVA